MTERIQIGVSACLLGQNVRFDGGHKNDRFITDTRGQYVECVPVCSETECGLGVPRESSWNVLGYGNNGVREHAVRVHVR